MECTSLGPPTMSTVPPNPCRHHCTWLSSLNSRWWWKFLWRTAPQSTFPTARVTHASTSLPKGGMCVVWSSSPRQPAHCQITTQRISLVSTCDDRGRLHIVYVCMYIHTYIHTYVHLSVVCTYVHSVFGVPSVHTYLVLGEFVWCPLHFSTGHHVTYCNYAYTHTHTHTYTHTHTFLDMSPIITSITSTEDW